MAFSRRSKAGMLRLTASLVIAVAALANQSPARACSCALTTPETARDMVTAVFEGEVVRVCADGVGGVSQISKFRVLRAWKGVSADEFVSIRAATSSAACGFEWTVGDVVLVYASYAEGVLNTGLCWRTTSSSLAGEDFAALGTPASVTSGAIPPEGELTCTVTSGGVDGGTEPPKPDAANADAAKADAANADAGKVSGDTKSSGCSVSGPVSDVGMFSWFAAAVFAAAIVLGACRRRRSF